MSTGYSPIGLALRDVGQGVGNILSDEALRRRDDLAATQELNRVSLAQAQLGNQAQVAEAQGQVSLAQAAAEARQFDVKRAQEQQRIAQEAEFQRGQLKIAETKEAREERARQDLAEHQKAMEETAQVQADASARAAAAQERSAAASQAYHDTLRAQVQRGLDLGARPVYIDDTLGSIDNSLIQAYGPEEGARRGQIMRTILTAHLGDVEHLPKDANGRHYTTADVMAEVQKQIQPFYKSLVEGDKYRKTPQEIAGELQTNYAKFPDEFRAAHPWQDWLPGAWAQQVDPSGYAKLLRTNEANLKQARAKLEAQFATEQGLKNYPTASGGPPTQDTKHPLYKLYQEKVQMPLDALRTKWEREGSYDLLAPHGGVPEVPPPAVTVPPPRTPAPPPAPAPAPAAPPPNRYAVDEAFRSGFALPELPSVEAVQQALPPLSLGTIGRRVPPPLSRGPQPAGGQ